MECCYPEDCGEYAVSPVLLPSCYPKCEPHPICYPCLPQCPKIIYCCAPPRPSAMPRRREKESYDDYQACCERGREREHEQCCEYEYEQERDRDRDRDRTPPRCHRRPSPPPYPPRASMQCMRAPPPCCPATYSPCEPTCCKPVRTKYVIPCYRYEDGRINQPTLLMRRACEVAVGNRLRKKPFVVSSDYQDPYNEVHRYHSEDEKGNFCFHIERKNPHKTKCEESDTVHPVLPSQPCSPCPHCEYTEFVHAEPVDPKNCCYFCK